MENYEKLFKEALERARKIYESEEGRIGMTPVDLEEIFPELKESEDEKIRKALHIYLDWLDGRNNCAPKGEYSIREMIAWLKRQKPADKNEPTKIEPKFKTGDRVKHKDEIVIYTIDSITVDGSYIMTNKKHNFRKMVSLKEQDKLELVERKPINQSEEDEVDWIESLRPQTTETYNPYKTAVKVIAEMCERYKDYTDDKDWLYDFFQNVKAKCKEVKVFDAMYSDVASYCRKVSFIPR